MGDELATDSESQHLRGNFRQIHLISEQKRKRENQMELTANNLATDLADALKQIEGEPRRRNDFLSIHHQSIMGVRKKSLRLGAEKGELRVQAQAMAQKQQAEHQRNELEQEQIRAKAQSLVEKL